MEVGAMENWGAITFVSTSLESRPGEAFGTFFYNCRLVCHEISHMWFGNLVTMAWWNDLWLNEGFARFMEFKCLSSLRKKFRPWFRFVTDVLYRALAIDFPVSRTHPVEIPCVNPDLIYSYFDDISYLKGASLLRMLENLMGEEKFNEAMQGYLRRFRDGSVVSRDFFQTIGEYCEFPVQDIMETWTQQPGYPLVTVNRVNGNHFRVVQRPFDRFGSELWKIPIRFVSDAKESNIIVLEEREGVIHTEREAKWIKVNYESTGFYRVLYDDYTEIFEDLKDMSASDRYGIVNDIISYFNTRTVQFSHIIDLIEAVVPEYEYAIILILTNFLTKTLFASEIDDKIIPLLCKLFLPIWKRYRLTEESSEIEFSEFRLFYCSNLIRYCKEEEVAKEFLEFIDSNNQYLELRDMCLQCILSQESLDRVASERNFRKSVLLESINLDLIRFALNAELNYDEDRFGNSMISYAINQRNRRIYCLLIRALILEYVECEEGPRKAVWAKHAYSSSMNAKNIEAELLEFANILIAGLDPDRESELDILLQCYNAIIKLQKN